MGGVWIFSGTTQLTWIVFVVKKVRTKLCLLPQISGVEVAPCLLPKISGVEVTPFITSVESSEQFWRTCEPWWREMQCNDTSWLKTKDQNEGWYQTRKSQGDRNWEGGSQEGRYRVVEPRFITQTLNDNKVLATQNSAKERSAYNLASPGALTCGHCCGWRCLLWSLCVTKETLYWMLLQMLVWLLNVYSWAEPIAAKAPTCVCVFPNHYCL